MKNGFTPRLAEGRSDGSVEGGRRGLDRDPGLDARAARRGARHRQAPAERLDPVGESAQAAALRRVGAADAVVGHRDAHAAPSSLATATSAAVAAAYFVTFVSASAMT